MEFVPGRLAWATGIEDTFVPQEGPGLRRLDEYELQQHYVQWGEDLDLAAGLGFDALRYGIPWYRVEPEDGRFDWRFTDLVVPAMVERGLEPIVDLIHYGTPLWLRGEFRHPDYPRRVAAYAAAFAERYRALVRYFTPLNEPFINAELCGRLGRWPPNLTGDAGFVKVLLALCEGMVETVEALRAVRSDAVIVHVEATGYGSTEDPALAERLGLDLARQTLALDLITGRVDQRHRLRGYVETNGVSDAELAWFRDHAVDIDVLGLNYYPFLSVWRRFADADGATIQELVWGGAEYLDRAVRDHHARYQMPIFVTECSHNERFVIPAGSPYPKGRDGEGRAAWLEEAVAASRRLVADGVPLVGFTWWPLYDLVSWDYREGSGPVESYLEPMGLYRLRMDSGGVLRREPLLCADRMQRAIAAWRAEEGTAVPR